MAKVTVIVPIYNVEEYLPKCLDSLTNQTFKDIEIWAVSDGSPDNSVNIVKKYAKKDDRVKCIEKENGGYGSVLEYAINNINTEYFIVCDPDDYLATDAIEKLYNLATANEVDLVIGAKYLVYNDNNEEIYDKSMESFCKVIPNKKYEKNELGELAFLHVSPHSKLYKTDIAKGIEFPRKVSFTDFELYILSLTNANSALYTDEALSYYLVDRPGNSMTDVNPKIFGYHNKVFESTTSQLAKKENVDDLIYARVYYQFRGVANLFRLCKDENKNDYRGNLIEMLEMIEDKNKNIVNGLFYADFKGKIFAKGLLNKKTRNYFFNRLVK